LTSAWIRLKREFLAPLETKAALFTLVEGRIHREPVTIPEGLTGEEIAALLRPGDAEGAAAFRRAFLDPGPIADLDPRARDLEGYLFPPRTPAAESPRGRHRRGHGLGATGLDEARRRRAPNSD
jgi:hypothetical protein